jgi:hypothetical protein
LKRIGSLTAGCVLGLSIVAAQAATPLRAPLREHIGSSVVERLRDPKLARARALAPELRQVLDTLRDNKTNPKSPEAEERELLAGFYYHAATDPDSARPPSRRLPNEKGARELENEIAWRLDLLKRELVGLDGRSAEFEKRVARASRQIFGSWEPDALLFMESVETAARPSGVRPARRKTLDQLFKQDLAPLPKQPGTLKQEIEDILGASGDRAYLQSVPVLREIHNRRFSLQGSDAALALRAYLRHLKYQVAEVLPRVIEAVEAEERRWWYPGKGARLRKAREAIQDAESVLTRYLIGGGDVDLLVNQGGIESSEATRIHEDYLDAVKRLGAISRWVAPS